MNLKTTNKQGFTIIEVVLVLAIAGLIFLMVFLALPALQRSQRDSQRKSDMSRLVGALNDYKAANRGKIPDNGATGNNWSKFVDDYLIGRKGGGANDRDTFVDPSGPKAGTTDTTYVLTEQTATSTALSGDFEANQNIIYYTTGARCDEGGDKVVGEQGARVVAFRMKLENAGWYCLDN